MSNIYTKESELVHSHQKVNKRARKVLTGDIVKTNYGYEMIERITRRQTDKYTPIYIDIETKHVTQTYQLNKSVEVYEPFQECTEWVKTDAKELAMGDRFLREDFCQRTKESKNFEYTILSVKDYAEGEYIVFKVRRYDIGETITTDNLDDLYLNTRLTLHPNEQLPTLQ